MTNRGHVGSILESIFHAARGGVMLLVVWGLCGGQTLGQTKTKFDPDKIRAEMEQVRKRLDAERRDSKPLAQEFDRKFETSVRNPVKSSGPRYGLKAGKEFGYEVVLAWKTGSLLHQVVGRPFYQVRYQFGSEQTPKYAVLALAHFQHYVAQEGDTQYRLSSKGDYWSHPVLIFGERHITHRAHDQWGDPDLPFLMSELISLDRMIFPPLPQLVGGDTFSDEPGAITVTRGNVTLWEGFTSSGSGGGRVVHKSESQSANGSRIQLKEQHSFIQGAGGVSAVYQGNSTFDTREGLLDLLQGTYSLQDGKDSAELTVTVKRLSGADLETAKQAAMADLRKGPQEVIPVEFNRKPIQLTLPKSYSSTELPAVNEKVGYYDERMDQHFEMTFVEQVSTHEVKIRYEGSGEILIVKPAAMRRLSP